MDVAALASRFGLAVSGRVLSAMDDYYADQHESGRGVTTQLVRMLADPRPYDLDLVDLASYRRLEFPWRDWSRVEQACGELAVQVLSAVAVEEDMP